MATLELTGLRFGKWTVIKRSGTNKWRASTWACLCDCATRRDVVGSVLIRGESLSCGCDAPRMNSEQHTIHGESGKRVNRLHDRSPEYSSWLSMIARCFNKSHKAYHQWGGRGITVCERWKSSYTLFLDDMGRRPSRTHSIERINNNGNYEPGNCKWATPEEQSNNTRRNHLLEFNGKTLTIAQWGKVTGLGRNLYNRIYNGWPIERALKR
jgi:hypothetical protein